MMGVDVGAELMICLGNEPELVRAVPDGCMAGVALCCHPAPSTPRLTAPPDSTLTPPTPTPPPCRLSENATARAAFAHLERKLAALERCTLLVDTRGEGAWSVLWASSTWDALCGAALTREAVLQRSMQECFGSAAGSEDMWGGLNVESTMRESFTLQKAQLIPGSTALSTKPKFYDLIFRPAGSGPVDELAPAAVIPSSVRMESELQHLYCVTVLRHDRKAKARWLAGHDLRQQLGQLGQVQDEIQGLEVDWLLGRGFHAAVYHGVWNGQEVAVKMLQVSRADVWTAVVRLCRRSRAEPLQQRQE